ncbi:MAG TPA: penicillin-binding protein activator [Desulfobacterales bacterium]|nr:penicillin-binding protein activator [Desulfobacterales bacterium]
MRPIKIVLFLTVAFLLVACAIKPVPEEAGPGYQLFSQAEKMLQAKSYEKALELFKEYYERFPDGPLADAALMKMASIHATLGDFEQARSIYHRLIDEHPESPFVSDAGFEIIVMYYNQGEYDRVIEQATQFLKQKPSRVHVQKTYVLLGDTYNAMSSPKDAVNYYIMALRISKDIEKDSIIKKLKVTIAGLEHQDIITLFNQVKDNTLKGYLMFQLGLIYTEKEEYDEALKILTAFTEKFPEHENVQQAKRLISLINKRSVYSRYTIGCLLPLSGPYKIYGNGALKGIQLAFNQFNAKNPERSIKIIVKDTGSDSAKSEVAVKELFEENVAAIIGPVITSGSAAKAAQNYRIPIITLTQKDNIPELGEYVFRNFITPGMQVKALVSYAAKELGLKSYAILYPDEKYGETFMNLFWDEVIAHKGKVVGVESYRPDGTDFADPIKKLVGLYYDVPEDLKNIDETAKEKENGEATENIIETLLSPLDDKSENWDIKENEESEAIVDFDAVFIPDAPKKSGLIIPQLAFYDVKDTYLFGTNLWHSDNLIDMAYKHAQGAIMPDGFFAESKSQNVKQFVDGYNEIFHQKPGFIEAVAYDTALILFQIVSRPDVRFRSVIKNELKRIDGFKGVTGLTSFDNDGNAIKNLYLLQIRGQRFVELERR